MNNTYFVKIKLFKNNLEMAQHNKVVTVIIEAFDEQQITEIVDVNHEILVCDKVD
tara:strand:+ start:196 stop:360 length:165 start_codon:yes stop_codon:yes gene_type:complete